LRLTTSNFIFQLNTCGYSPYVTSSLTRVWFCRLELLLVLANAVILRFESRGTHDHILLSQILDSLNLEDQIPLFISPRNRVARLYPPTLGSLFVASYDSQGLHISAAKTSRLMLLRETIAVYCEDHMKHTVHCAGRVQGFSKLKKAAYI
jgi:hypothetical protein